MTRLPAAAAAELRWAVLSLDEAAVLVERADLERRLAIRTHRDTPHVCAMRRAILAEAIRCHTATAA